MGDNADIADFVHGDVLFGLSHKGIVYQLRSDRASRGEIGYSTDECSYYDKK